MRKLLIATSATFVVLVATGLYQMLEYRPRSAKPVGRSVLYDATDWLHRWGSYVFIGLLIALAVALSMRGDTGRRVLAYASLVIVAIASIIAIIEGPDLRWNQLVLWAVTAASDIKGMFWDHAKAVGVASRAVAPDEFRRDVWVHLLVWPALITGGLGVLWYSSRREDPLKARTDESELEVTT